MKRYLQLLFVMIFLLVLMLLFFIPADLKTAVMNKMQIDTVGHIIGFFGLTWILVGILKLPVINTVICLFFYSALTEVSQHYLGFRNGEFADFIADIVGISLFAVCHYSLAVYVKPQQMNN